MTKLYDELSGAVSHALRHEPWLYEIELDANGWTDVEALLTALRGEIAEWRNLASSDLTKMIRESSKQRHEMVNGRIRALYGHSLPGKLSYTPEKPPSKLFHGTAPETLPMIHESGLMPMGRQYVHLSVDRDTALAVGRRKSSSPMVLLVRAEDSWEKGTVFYQGNDKVWLAHRVPPDFINFE
jgi:putative RNA 2'-phosphotransferase